MRWNKPIVIGGVIFLALWLGWNVWYHYALAPLDAANTTTQTITVASGEGVNEIADQLQQKQIIKSGLAFEVYATLHGYRSHLETGVYEVSPSQEVRTIAKKIATGDVVQHRLTIPEGATIAQITDLAAKQGISAADFKAALKDSYNYSFLAAKPATVDLEGYLFPDTYTFSPTITAHALIDQMLANFNQKVPGYSAAFAAHGLTLHQGLTLASVIEKEVSRTQDRPIVAQIFYSRLKAGQALQSDVTVDYAAKLLGKPFDISLNSPYNTYKNTGLPIGPICNPGVAAIEAAANPASTDYSYFLAGKDGTTHFAHTFAEHQQNIQKYLQ